jgi:hypothetical protein
MNWTQAFITRLLADAPLNALVGNRINWVERPQGEDFPAITMQVVSDARNQILKGYDSIQPARVQIDIWAPTYSAGREVLEAFLSAAVPAQSGNGHTFSRAMVELPPRDLSERLTFKDGSSKTVFRTSLDLIVNRAPTEEVS